MNPNILVIEDESSLREILLESLTLEGYQPKGAKSAEEAAEFFEVEKFDVILTDINLPGKSGLEFLPTCFQHNPEAYVLVMTGYGTIDTAVQAMKLGASDFLCKPISLNDLTSAIRLADKRVNSKDETRTATSPSKVKTSKNREIIAESRGMLNLLEQVETIAPYKINTLITGETGTGKELFAKAIHNSGPRKKEAFVPLNCAAIPEHLLEDELFGHIKGAYTGAANDRQGRFEQADGGTLFLDEIGDMNQSLQMKLLRVLQENEFEKLGSTKTIKVDVRVVAATCTDVEQKMNDGTFRADLYHRLNVVHLHIPPLRDRRDDIMPIADGLLKRFCKASGLPDKLITEEVQRTLLHYDFPGNVRQLQNCIERAAVYSGPDFEIKIDHLSEEVRSASGSHQNPASGVIPEKIPDEGIDLSSIVSGVERELLIQTLDKTGGNKMQAAKLLNMKRTTLVEKIKRLQLEEDIGKDESNDLLKPRRRVS